MPERGFASETWDSDGWFQELNIEQRYLFIYTWTNNHCNQAGLYHITLTTVSNETKISKTDLPGLLQSLTPKVVWYPDSNLIWVKNFLKRQAKSSKFLAAAAKSLTQVKDGEAVRELLQYNLSRYSISIPYQYYIDKVSILTRVTVPVPDTVTVPGSETEEEIVKGGNQLESPGSTDATPTSESEIEESLSPGDREIIATWCSVSGFSMPFGAAAELVARMRTEFGDVDLLQVSKEWAVRKISEPLTPDSRPGSQLWHWMAKAREIASRNGESAAKHRPGRNPEDTYKKCRECGWKGKTSERQCPACKAKGDVVYLEKDYASGRYGHLVKQ